MTTATAPAAAAPVAPAASIVARDFPGWLPPMLVKELRQGLRTRGFVSTLVGFQAVKVGGGLGARDQEIDGGAGGAGRAVRQSGAWQ